VSGPTRMAPLRPGGQLAPQRPGQSPTPVSNIPGGLPPPLVPSRPGSTHQPSQPPRVPDRPRP
jgi:hypothetical protein